MGGVWKNMATEVPKLKMAVATGIHQNLCRKNNNLRGRNFGDGGAWLSGMGSINWKPGSDGGTGVNSFMFA
jgi:hypothetical protein